MAPREWALLSLLAGTLSLTGCGGGGDPSPAAGGLPTRGVTASGALSAAAGSFCGRVVFDGARPARQKLLVVKDVEVCRKVDHRDDRLVVDDRGGIRYAVVTVRGVGKKSRAPAETGEYLLDQRACAYEPHVIIVPVGRSLRIQNSDGILHNIHTYSTLNRPFNVAQPKSLRVLEKTFAVPERIGVRCDVHGWMSSWVIVVDDDYNAVTDEAGRFDIRGIPPGRYTAVCWQEELGELSAEIVVDGEGPALNDFTYRVPADSAALN